MDFGPWLIPLNLLWIVLILRLLLLHLIPLDQPGLLCLSKLRSHLLLHLLGCLLGSFPSLLLLPIIPPTATTKLLTSSPELPIFVWLCALVLPWVLSLLLSEGLNVLGKLDCGQRRHWRAAFENQGQHPRLISSLRSTSSCVLLALLILSGLPRLPSTSGSSHPFEIPTPSPIPFPALPKPESTVQPLVLLFLTSNEKFEGPQGSHRRGCGHSLHPTVAPWHAARPGGFCGPGGSEERRGSVGCPTWSDPQEGPGRWCHFSRGSHGGTFQADHGPWRGGGREWTRCSLRCRHNPDVGRLQPIRVATHQGVQPCQRHPRDPLFLGRISSGGACIESPLTDGFGLDERGGDRKSPLLLSGGECPCACCGATSPKEDGEGRAQEEDHQRCLGRSVVRVVSSAALHHAGAAELEGEAGSLRRCIGISDPGTRWTSTSQTAFPNSWSSGHSSGFCKAGGACTEDKSITCTRDKTGCSRCPFRRRSTPTSCRSSRSFQCCSGPSYYDPGHLPTEPGHECSGGALGWHSGSIGRPGLSFFDFAFDQRSWEEREASADVSKQEWGLLPSGMSPSLEEDQTIGAVAGFPQRVPPKGHLLEVHGEARGPSWTKRLRSGALASLPDWRCNGSPRQQRSSGVVGPHFGSCGSSSTGWREVGSGVPLVATGRPTPVHLHLESLLYQSQTPIVLPAVPTTMGDHGIGFRQGTGRDRHSTSRSFRSKENWRGQSGADRRHGEPKQEVSVSQKAEKRRGQRCSLGRDEKAATALTSTTSTGGCHEDPSLGSGLRACKAGCDEEKDVLTNTWTSLQSHSFVKWCSSLPRKVLNSGTPFGAFLLETFHLTRSGVSAPAELLFPLPVPKPGVFAPLPSRCSSRRRRRRNGFEQAFHVVVMALNFLHADCTFGSLQPLELIPNLAQMTALANIKGILKAFGNCAGEIDVPASGRRSTTLVSMLADLSEFFTKHGLSGSAYESGFDAALQSKDGFEVDVSRAEELVPYRSLDPSRLKLSGTAQWSPLGFLDDDLWLPYVEPNVLIWTNEFDHADLPRLDKEEPAKVLELAKVWDVNGLLHLSPKPVTPGMKPACLRVFNCYKSPTTDRQIGDKRGRNQIESYLPGPSRSLPTGPNLSVLEIDPLRQRLSICLSDRKDFYHQFQISTSRAESNVMWPPLKLADFAGTKAYDRLQEAHRSRRIKQPREAVGDFLGGPTLSDYGPKLPEEVYACFNSVVQGDHLGVEIATQSHRNMLKSRGLLCGEEELLSTLPFAGRQTAQGLIIDDFFSVSIEELSSGGLSQSERRFRVAQDAYQKEGLIGSKEKDVVNQDRAKVAGAELDCSAYTRGLGLCTVAAPAAKRLGLSFLSLQLASLRATTDALHACIVGGWTSCLMFRRPLMAILDKVHSFADLSLVDQSDPKVLRLPRLVAQEFVLLGVLAPLACSDIASKLSPEVFATDASDLKGAIVIPMDFALLSGELVPHWLLGVCTLLCTSFPPGRTKLTIQPGMFLSQTRFLDLHSIGGTCPRSYHLLASLDSRGSLQIGFVSFCYLLAVPYLGSTQRKAGASATMLHLPTLSPGVPHSPGRSIMISLTLMQPLVSPARALMDFSSLGLPFWFSLVYPFATLTVWFVILLPVRLFRLLDVSFVCLVSVLLCLLVFFLSLVKTSAAQV